MQALRDKEKGNTEDYQREMMKAVDQLTACADEDPADYEAVGYLGWKRQHGAGHRAGDHEKLHARKRALPPPPAAVDDGPDDGEA